ncbi:hypothetical protein [Duganella qianjiadongensis]|uniref:EamA family transporter n=1 Tax=Duganella qianjiadongensis TaxID=2692176 RepID=A0ABW9VL13_9BURK|nr:hypothetical protein [Duganella qianjiadongensis]MYM39397.1 hypothetical protein [Duganella qianjiadongensis]
MSTYAIALIWTLSNIACHLIAHQRQIRITPARAMLAAVLGPLTLPAVALLGPARSSGK